MQHSMESPQEHVVSAPSETKVCCTGIIEEELMEFWILLVQHASGCVVWFDVGKLPDGTNCYVVSTLGDREKVDLSIELLTPELESLIAHSHKQIAFGTVSNEMVS